MHAVAHIVPDDTEESYTLKSYFENDLLPDIGFAFEVVVSIPLLEGKSNVLISTGEWWYKCLLAYSSWTPAWFLAQNEMADGLRP